MRLPNELHTVRLRFLTGFAMKWLRRLLGVDQFSIDEMMEKKLERERLFREDFTHRLQVDMKAYLDAALHRNAGRSPLVFPGADRVFIHTIDGHRLFLDPHEMFMTLHLIENGEWESHVRNLLRIILEPGAFYVDVGANTGVHALFVASLIGERGKVLAVEPHPRVRSLLHDNFEINGLLDRIEILPVALGDESREDIEFEYFDKHPAMSGIKVSPLALERFNASATKIRVACETLDGVLSAENRLPDVVKIDVEGFETLVLKGAERTISANPDITFLIEHQSPLAASVLPGNPSADLFEFFTSRGFTIIRFRDDEPPVLIRDVDGLMPSRSGDYLFVRPDSATFKKIVSHFGL